MHSNQSWVFSSVGRNISPAHAAGLTPAPPFYTCGLEHQPSPHGWAESSPVVADSNISLVHAAGLSPAQLTEGWNISPTHAAVLSPALWLGQYRPSSVHFIFSFFLFVPSFQKKKTFVFMHTAKSLKAKKSYCIFIQQRKLKK